MPAVDKRDPSLFILALLLCALYLVMGPYLRLSQWSIHPDTNAAWLEARAWLDGRVDLTVSPTLSDIAWRDGRAFNPFPPLLTLLCTAALWLQRLFDYPADSFYPPWFVMCVALPLPLVGYWAFREVLNKPAGRVRGPEVPTQIQPPVESADPSYKTLTTDRPTLAPYWPALLTFTWLTGTALHPILITCRDGHLCSINHALSQIGLMLIAGDLLGRRRLWPALIGLAIATWTRQLTLLYSLPILYLAWRPVFSSPRIAIRGLPIALTLIIIIIPLLTLNYLKFNHPLDFGYLSMYDRRTDDIARLAKQHGLFTIAMIGENFRCMNLAVPPWEWAGAGPRPTFDNRGTSMWFTSPLLLLVLWDIRRWWNDTTRRALMLGTLPVIAGILLYHTTGAGQSGYYRYALDFIPIWLAVIAPHAAARPRFTLAVMAWSAVYFTLIA